MSVGIRRIRGVALLGKLAFTIVVQSIILLNVKKPNDMEFALPPIMPIVEI
jgi:hypothetical protein